MIAMRRSAALVFLSFLVVLSLQAAPQRLENKKVVPLSEKVAIKADPRAAEYSGSVSIRLKVSEPVDQFEFHAQEMKLTRVELRSGEGKRTLETKEGEFGLVTAKSPSTIVPGEYDLEIDFEKTFDTRAVSFYRMKQGEDWYAFSQFQAADARRAFPSWDEPEFKIPFQATLTVPRGMEAVTNTPESRRRDLGEWTEFSFAPTLPLPTYLITFAIGPLEFVDIPGMSVPGRVVTVKGASHLAKFAVEATPRILAAEEKYFGMKYPYEKLDLIAIPEYWYGAMEHPGAITYSDRVLLLDPNGATIAQKRNQTRITAHELAHQWFGNLVTMQWWDDLWLNESFADWFGDKINAELYPEYKSELLELSRSQEAMAGDTAASSEAIRREVENAQTGLEDLGLIYNKGKLVLAMFEQWIGPESFRKGVVAHINAHKHGNATADDFWKALAKAGTKELVPAMSTFINQPGVPLLEFSVNGKEVTIRQRRLANYGTTVKPHLWQVPVSFWYADAKGVRTKSLLLKKESETVKLPSEPKWIIPNVEARGYYRWNLPAEAMLEISSEEENRLSERERIGFLANATALLSSGDLKGADYLKIIGDFAGDPEPQVVSDVVGSLYNISYAFVPDDMADEFAVYVRKTLRPVLDKYGMEPRAGEDPTVAVIRPQLLRILAFRGGDPEVIAFGKATAAKYLAEPASVDPALRAIALSISALDGDRALFDEYRKRFETAKIPNERGAYIGALGAFQRPELRKEALVYALEGPVRPNELFSIPIALGETEAGRVQLFDWMTANYEKITSKLPPPFHAYMPSFASSCSEELFAKAKGFFAEPAHRVEGTEAELKKVEERVNDCVTLRKREGKTVATYLESLQ